MEKLLMETAIPNEYTFKMKEAGFAWVPDDTHVIPVSMFSAIAHYLSAKKRKDASVGAKLTTTKGDFLLGATVTYIVNEEDEDMPGNWDLAMTFNEEDFNPEVELSCNDQAFTNIFCQMADRMYGAYFNANHYIGSIYTLFAMVLKTHLDINAKADDVCSVTIPKAVTAKVVVEDDRKIMSLVPDETLKQIVKDDAREEII